MVAHLCDAECRAMPECRLCGRRKKPVGRDAGGNGNGYCDTDCAAYALDPRSGHLWPGEACDHPSGECAVCAADEKARTT